MNQRYDPAHATQIADGVWWVGRMLPDDPFQCHVYLIENGEDSILIDPGSILTWEGTRRKILEVMPLERIRYIVCQHQDPDITTAVELLLEEVGGEGRKLVTHWRCATLLKHYDWDIDFYEVDEHQWHLDAGERRLEFVFTPYMHFAGNICTYDPKTKVLFSSDIFGAFTEGFSLYAEDAKSYFEQMKPFHIHYMPSKEIVNHGLDAIEEKDIEMIAPQHGSIIKKEMIPIIVSRLRKLDVGLYLHFGGYKDVKRLSKANEVLTKLFELITYTTGSLYDKIGTVIMLINDLFSLERVVCFGNVDGDIIMFDSSIDHPIERDIEEKELYSEISKSLSKESGPYLCDTIFQTDLHKSYLVYSFVTYSEQKSANGLCYFLFSPDEVLDDQDIEILNSFRDLFSIMLIKEIGYYRIQKERCELINKSIVDNLTRLHNRHYLEEIAPKELQKAKTIGYPFSAMMIDLDNFKQINDKYGHDTGDSVLRDFARFLQTNLRESDFLFRYGGEEFLILLPFTTKDEALVVIERIRALLEERRSPIACGKKSLEYTFSAGIAELTEEKSIDELIKKCDEKLYQAKKRGRNCTSV